jgi:AraC family transcriptional regulator of adaptative response / DNA-3-methyladenine glycosylase II
VTQATAQGPAVERAKAPGTFLPGRLERDEVLRSLVSHSVPGVEHVDAEDGTVARLVHGASGSVAVTVSVGSDGVRVLTAGADDVLETIREWFDLNTDVDAIGAAFRDDPALGALARRRPALRVVGHPDAFEAATQTVLGQQVSLAACRTFTGRLAAAYGTAGQDGLLAFPPAETVAGAEQEELRAVVGIPAARARTVIALAEAFASGLSLAPGSERGEARTRLLALPGIGPWTVDYLALRVMHDPDAYPVGDLVLRRALGGVTAADALGLGERWRPWRAYATVHLWAEDAARRALGAAPRPG